MHQTVYDLPALSLTYTMMAKYLIIEIRLLQCYWLSASFVDTVIVARNTKLWIAYVGISCTSCRSR